MHGSLSYVVVNMLIELASNSTRYTGGKYNGPLYYLNTPARKASVSAAPPAGDCAALCVGAVMTPGAAVLARSQAGLTPQVHM